MRDRMRKRREAGMAGESCGGGDATDGLSGVGDEAQLRRHETRRGICMLGGTGWAIGAGHLRQQMS